MQPDTEKFDVQTANNEKVFRDILQRVRPDLFVIMELLDSTGVNPNILLKVIRHLSNIANGRRYGKVTIEIDNGTVTFVTGEERDRLQEPILDGRDIKNYYR